MRWAKDLALFGHPDEPYFEPDTINAVYAASTRQIQTDAFGHRIEYYQCGYCRMDPRVLTEAGTWHPRQHTQIDHRTPFSTLVGTTTYNGVVPALIGRGIAPWGATAIDWTDRTQAQIAYNDIDNLWIVCANHNQEKKAKPTFHGHMVMGMGNLVHHKTP